MNMKMNIQGFEKQNIQGFEKQNIQGFEKQKMGRGDLLETRQGRVLKVSLIRAS